MSAFAIDIPAGDMSAGGAIDDVVDGAEAGVDAIDAIDGMSYEGAVPLGFVEDDAADELLAGVGVATPLGLNPFA